MKKYNITYSNEHNFIWYRTAKCGTRTVLQYIKDSGASSTSRYKMQYQSNWNDYFQFTFVRNPWERLVSVYFSKFTFNKAIIDIYIMSNYHTIFGNFINALCFGFYVTLRRNSETKVRSR